MDTHLCRLRRCRSVDQIGLRVCDYSSMRRLIRCGSLSVAVYSFAVWVYVAAVAVVTPQYLHLQLTHLARWPRTDTFGEFCFVLSFVSFFIYQLARSPQAEQAR